jgi:hypothetical protein
MKTVYQACDGEIFEDRAEASAHENWLFDFWLNNLLEGHPEPTLSAVVRHFNDSHYLTCEGDEHHMTPWDRLKEALGEYWEDTVAPELKHTQRSD